MRRTLSLLVLTLAILAAAGCASNDWNAFGYDSRHFSKQPNEIGLTPSTVGTLHQNFDFTAAGTTFTASPSVYENVVFIGGLDGVFYAVHATGTNKGTLKWRYPPAAAATADGCGITTQPLMLPAGQSGNPSGPGIASSAAIVAGVPGHTRAVIFGAPDPTTSPAGGGRVWALDSATGQCIWKSPIIAPASGTSKIGYSSPAIAHGNAYIGVSARIPDNITIGRMFAVRITDGTLDPAFNYSSAGPPAGGGIWSSPAITPSGNVVVVTGNSCRHWVPVTCSSPTVPDFSNSLLKIDWTSGNVLWQVQPVHSDFDNDPDWAVPPIVGQVSCGSVAITVQKDGYLHAVDIKTGGPFSNPACSYAGHSLECPRWTFPTVASLPFQEDGHGDTRFIRPGALDGDRLYITTGGFNLTEMPPTDAFGQSPAGRIRLDRLYSLNVCSAPADRIRWIFTSPSGSLGGISTANGIIYAGSNTGHLYAIADPTVLPPSGSTCTYPNLPADPTCTAGGFTFVPTPALVRDISGLSGDLRGIPAISNGQVIVATTAGHIYGFIP